MFRPNGIVNFAAKKNHNILVDCKPLLYNFLQMIARNFSECVSRYHLQI